jgi:dynamin 1-like protein
MLLSASPHRLQCIFALAIVLTCFDGISGNAGLGHLLPVINKLQDVMAMSQVSANALELPQIVVVGSQSSGKSSVLESIVGKDFLPRGSGIVTRAPLILQLQTLTSNPADGCEEWGEFLHCPQKKFTAFKDIRKEIEDETVRITGKKQAISHTPIRLRITSRKIPNLTLVDLPGMTKVPVGDQPADIEAQIRDLVLKYTANPNSIILAVTPANSDIATSDAIQISRAVDPSGDRTLGVLTKIDLMDRGTNAREMLNGRVVPLKLGFIGVINRSQKDINDDKEIDAARKDEMHFFMEHSAYTQLATSGLIGTGFLSKRLNQILLNHIKSRLPVLRNRVSSLIAASRKELTTLGDAPSQDAEDRRKLLISIITQYVNNFCTTIDGGRHLTSFTELRGGARVSHTFNTLFPQNLGAISPHDALRPAEVHTTIRNTKGARTSLHGAVPQDAFEMLVRRLIRRLREPAAWCVDAVSEELRVIAEQVPPPLPPPRSRPQRPRPASCSDGGSAYRAAGARARVARACARVVCKSGSMQYAESRAGVAPRVSRA